MEIQVYDPDFGEWFTIGPTPMTTTNTFYQPDLSAIYPENQFKWRVIAVSTFDGDVFNSAPSSWRSFSFGAPPAIRLATPHVTSPSNNIQVGVGMPLTLNWDPVPGADLYIVHRDKLVDGVWKNDPPTIVTTDKDLPLTTVSFTSFSAWNDNNPAGTYRWTVVASSGLYPDYIYSNPSTWRTFTVF